MQWTAGVVEPVRRLGTRQFVEFCAALWAARGYETRIVDGWVVATRAGERVVLLPLTAPGPIARSVSTVRARVRRGSTPRATADDRTVDIVITPVDAAWAARLADDYGAHLVGPTVLAELLLYGVSRAAADELTTRFLGASTSTLLTAGPPASITAIDRPAVDLTALAAVAGIVCLVVAATLGGVWTPPSPSGDDASLPSAGAESDAVQIETGTDLGPPPWVVVVEQGAQAGDGPSAAERYPPGVADDSLDVEALSDAHATAIDGRAYRLVVRQSGTQSLDDDRRWRGAWEHAVVGDDDSWLFSVVGYVAVENGSELVLYTVYADGEFAYRRDDTRAGPAYERYPAGVADGDFGPHTDRTRGYLRRYLATSDVRVDRPSWNPDVHRLVATGQPTAIEGNVSNYTATALVDEDGFVSVLTVEYTLAEDTDDRISEPDERTVRFRFEYAAVDDTTVRLPGWYDEAVAATATNSTPD